MLSADESPGLFYFITGVIILVMAGVGLSLLIDRRFRFSSAAGQLQEEVASAAGELSELEGRHHARSLRLAGTAETLVAKADSLEKFSKSLKSTALRQSVLKEERDRLEVSILGLEEDFRRYRNHYRNSEWTAAAGEKLGTLRIRGGRDYVQAEIIRVSEAGLEIRHADGIARIPAPDLDPLMQDRFQWSDEGRRSFLRAERDQAPVPRGEVVPAADRVEEVDAGTDHEELKLLRQQVAGWQAKVAQLSADQKTAASRAGYGEQKSVPGSLETWKARAARLSTELVRARGRLALEKARLAAVAPGDPLLRGAGHE